MPSQIVQFSAKKKVQVSFVAEESFRGDYIKIQTSTQFYLIPTYVRKEIKLQESSDFWILQEKRE